jgi:hypothetical protein
MKKKIVFTMNCHAGYIIRNIKRYNHKILNDYDIYHINYASGTYLIDQNLTNDDVELIKKADVLIIQYIKNDRGMLNHDYIKQIAETNKIFILPHYRFSGYFYEELTLKLINENKTISQIENATANINIDEDTVFENLKSNLNNIKKMDELGCCNMFEYVKNNYKKKRLFQNRAHPNNLFFIELTNQLLQKLGYIENLGGVYENFSNHSNQICVIYQPIKNILKLDFDCNIYSNDIFISISEYFKIINYKTCFDEEIVNELNHLTRNIDKKYFGVPAFLNFFHKDLLMKTLELIR